MECDSVRDAVSMLGVWLDFRWKGQIAAVQTLGAALAAGSNESATDALTGKLMRSRGRIREWIARWMSYELRMAPITFPLGVLNTAHEFRIEHISSLQIPATIVFSICWSIGSTAAMSLFLAPIAWPISIALDVARSNRVRAACADALAVSESSDAAVALAVAVTDRSRRVRSAAIRSLKRLVSGWRLDSCQANDEAVSRQFSRLLLVPDEVLALLVISALGRSSTRTTLKALQRASTRAESKAVRDRAAETALIVEEHVRSANDAATLMRPGATRQVTGEGLLRSAVHNPQGDADTLLRESAETWRGA